MITEIAPLVFPAEMLRAAKRKATLQPPLAHAVGGKVEVAYRRGDLLPKRSEMMEDWAKYCSA